MALLRIILAIIFAALAARSLESQTLPSAVRWSVALPARAAASATIAGDVIVVGLQSGHVVAYTLKEGKEAWRVPLPADQAIVADEKLLFVAASEMIHALDAADGKVLWQVPSGTTTAPLLVHGGWVVAASAGQLTAYREIDGAKVWSRPSGPQHAQPSIEGNNLYVPLDEGRLLALDLLTGNERWTRFPAKGALSEVLALPDRVFVGASNKTFYAYDPDDGEIEWKMEIGTTLRGRPATDGTRVVITGMDNLVRAFDRGNGRLDWHVPVPYRPAGPVVVGSSAVVPPSPGNAAEIRAFQMTDGKAAGEITLEQQLAVLPAFGGAGDSSLMAAITGTLTGEWTLLVAGPPAPPAPPE